MDDPLILGFDSSAAHCAAALRCGTRLLLSRTEETARGQAERLLPLLEEMLEAEGLGWGDLDALAVGVGPGNFTGIRISVSAARGLALALGIPALGISAFELMRASAPPSPPSSPSSRRQLVAVAAPRDTAYVQVFDEGIPAADPRHIDPANPPGDLALPEGCQVIGAHAQRIAAAFPGLRLTPADADISALPETLTRLALARLGDADRPPPAPLYVRAADAAPPRDAPPVILP